MLVGNSLLKQLFQLEHYGIEIKFVILILTQ